MAGTKMIEVALPEGAAPSPEDLEALRATLGAVVGLHFPEEAGWEAVERELAADGWQVSLRLMWVAEARKGREFEQASGRTKEEACGRLLQLTRVDEPAGVP